MEENYNEAIAEVRFNMSTIGLKESSIKRVVKARDLAIKALEKQIPKKPDFTEDKEFALCPCCNGNGLADKQKYCDNCGQRLDWSEESGKTMRLISEDDVVALITNHHFDNDKGNFDLLIHNLCKEVRCINTAYDVDEVVEQFKTDSLVKLYGSGNSDNYLIPVKRAIEIVRAGGRDER